LPKKVIFDLDSTVLVLYGRQEFARVGYNPIKRGRPSYHPLLCFNGITKDFWHGELRPGDTHTSTGILELLEASFSKLPLSAKAVIIRADKGFYDHKTIEYLESKKALFAIVAKVTKPVKAKLSSLSYKRYTSGTESSEFAYQPKGWGKEYRFIVIRRPIPEEPSEQLSLFFNWQTQLSGHCNKFKTRPTKCLEVLRWQGVRRAYHQRTQRRVSIGEDSYKTICSQ
ncbi:hypothetical protein HKBW3C_03109, partial [Candidatus Hakubella thermalkaliphila]